MLDAFHSRMYGRGQQSHCTVDSALLTAAVLILTLLTIVILFFGVFVTPATQNVPAWAVKRRPDRAARFQSDHLLALSGTDLEQGAASEWNGFFGNWPRGPLNGRYLPISGYFWGRRKRSGSKSVAVSFRVVA